MLSFETSGFKFSEFEMSAHYPHTITIAKKLTYFTFFRACPVCPPRIAGFLSRFQRDLLEDEWIVQPDGQRIQFRQTYNADETIFGQMILKERKANPKGTLRRT